MIRSNLDWSGSIWSAIARAPKRAWRVTTGADNELSSNANYTYTYDADGNMSTRTNQSNGAVDTFTWDNRDRLVEDQTKSAGGTVLRER
jgi:YD repeat-containing protein